MNPSDPTRTAIPTTPARERVKGNQYSSAIKLPELERHEAATEQAKIEAQQKLSPQTPDAQGLNSSGLPSSEAYYKKKAAPLHTSAITPIVDSRIWIKIIAVGAIIIGLFWIKEAVDGLRFQSGMLPKVIHSIQLILSYFFFILPAYKLWVLSQEIDLLLEDRDESSMASVLYAHARLWKYGGIAVLGAILFMIGSLVLKKMAGLLTI